MRHTLGAAALAALLGAALPASAQPASTTSVSTTADLAAVCQPETTGVERLEAITYIPGYLTAVGQTHTALYLNNRRRSPLFCVSDPPPTVAQSGIAFAAWAKQNPQYANEPAVDGLLRWAQATYPCPAAAAPAHPRPRRGH